ncbi:hypothetical protein EVAR_20944_1 [Eumeta japonica]|uniref:Uncharacterized protein n=1 Tax=Eumeta variegata TaxID=151549 RepID=A0A4C1UW81_EUMVA|nr:hypothetical protein EVAR_20944_1 [Eumeta japonica]
MTFIKNGLIVNRYTRLGVYAIYRQLEFTVSHYNDDAALIIYNVARNVVPYSRNLWLLLLFVVSVRRPHLSACQIKTWMCTCDTTHSKRIQRSGVCSPAFCPTYPANLPLVRRTGRVYVTNIVCRNVSVIYIASFSSYVVKVRSVSSTVTISFGTFAWKARDFEIPVHRTRRGVGAPQPRPARAARAPAAYVTVQECLFSMDLGLPPPPPT